MNFWHYADFLQFLLVIAFQISGFSALPGGNYNNGSFNNVGSNANFWSATENNASNANNWNLNGSNANLNNNNKNNGFSVRCLQDSICEPSPF